MAAMAEIESLGFEICERPLPGSIPYAIFQGRSNSRWWLIPIPNRHVATSGLALFQPILASAKLMKYAALVGSSMGLLSLCARKKLYLTGKSCLAEMIDTPDLHYAFFTGTDSPHRKLVAQIMDAQGDIKGFAKVTRNATIKPLLTHEATTLKFLTALDIKTARTPTLIFNGELGGVALLVTDTLKTPQSKTITNLNGAHLAFIEELSQRTAATSTPSKVELINLLKNRLNALTENLTPQWQRRIDEGIEYVVRHRDGLLRSSLTHGDFTPWNTLFVDGQLYVFDLEYSTTDYPASNDLIHFMLASPGLNKQTFIKQIRLLTLQTRRSFHLESDALALSHVILYLISHSLSYFHRSNLQPFLSEMWDGAEDRAALIDAALKSAAG